MNELLLPAPSLKHFLDVTYSFNIHNFRGSGTLRGKVSWPMDWTTNNNVQARILWSFLKICQLNFDSGLVSQSRNRFGSKCGNIKWKENCQSLSLTLDRKKLVAVVMRWKVANMSRG